MKKPITLYNGSVSVTYSYDSTAQIYTPTDWSMRSICSLSDVVACEVREEKNGAYELSMTYVATGANADKIATDCILGVYCPLRDSVGENYFRIYRVEKDLGGHVQVSARHVSNDLIYNAVTHGGLSEIAPVSGGIQTFAGSSITHAYTAWLRHAANARIPFEFGGDAEVSTGFQMDFCTATSVRAYLGGEELQGYDLTARQAFPGCAYVWDKWDISLWQNRGQTRNQQITYGTNLADLLADDDTDGIYTYVCGFYLQSNGTEFKKYVGSLYQTNYVSLFPIARIKMLDCSAEITNLYPEGATTAQITAVLNNFAKAERDRLNYAGVPIRSITVDVVEASISDVYLCDTLPVLYKRNGIEINTSMEIVSYVWDVIMQRYAEITLGAIQNDLAKEIAQSENNSAVFGLQSNVATLQEGYASVAGTVATLQGDLSALAADVAGIIEAAETSSSRRYTRYMKFADGSLICMVEVIYTGTISTQSGSMYYGSQINLGSWPVSFINTPYISLSVQAGADSFVANVSSVSKTSAGITYLWSDRSRASYTYRIDIIAFGRWK